MLVLYNRSNRIRNKFKRLEKTMELWDLYDQDRKRLPQTMYRGNTQPAGTFRLIVHVCIFRSDGKMLIQHRQPFKEGWPDRWDLSVGGSAIYGDSPQMAAEREVQEEIGIRLDLNGIRPSLTLNFENGFDDYYLLNRDVELSDLSLQYEEVKEVRWASCEEILAMIDDDCFIPYHKSLIELLFYLRTHRDVRVRREPSVGMDSGN